MSIAELDKKVSAKLRDWGAPAFGFWKFVASKCIFVLFLIALGLMFGGWISPLPFSALIVSAYCLVLSIQLVIKRPRPDFSEPRRYKLLVHTYSFPSGHAAVSAATAAAIIFLTNFPSPAAFAIVSISAVLIAVLVSLSRVIVGVHYLGDVLAGFGLGILLVFLYALAV